MMQPVAPLLAQRQYWRCNGVGQYTSGTRTTLDPQAIDPENSPKKGDPHLS